MAKISLWRFGWYRAVRGWWARVAARATDVPTPHPIVIPIPHMHWRVCVWEGRGSYVATGKVIPGTNIELLCHAHSNRVVGIKIWD